MASTGTVRQLAALFGSSVAVRCPSSATRPASTRTSPAERSTDAHRSPSTSERLSPLRAYVGLDLTGTTLYFGSPSVKAEIAADLTSEQRQDLTIRKEIIWESMDATDSEARAVGLRLIRELRANDPEIGYNRWPKR
jgi:hypothetical protein